MGKQSSIKFFIALVIIVSTTMIVANIFAHRERIQQLSNDLVSYREASKKAIIQPTNTPFPTSIHNPKALPTQNLPPSAEEPVVGTNIVYEDSNDEIPWGVAQKVDDITYSIRVGHDDRMATPQEVLSALNQYRSINGVSSLAWDDKLGQYAQGRTDYFESIGSTDRHEGFNSFLENDDGFQKLGFRKLGENSYFGGMLTGVHLIEWVFAKSPGHNANQLDSSWTHAGVGVTDSSANLIFGMGQL